MPSVNFFVRYKKTLQELRNYIPRPLVHALGKEHHLEGTEVLLGALQHPRLNKQVLYSGHAKTHLQGFVILVPKGWLSYTLCITPT